tara:strand:+ start:161 stop:355 length:195 start_codon:yes stop_codon:yes gene_type:complete
MEKPKMKILKKYKDEDTWKVVTLEETIEYTEGSGYWKRGTVKEMLKEGMIIFTPTAEYKADTEK